MSSIAESTDTRTIRKPIEQVDKSVIDKLLTDLAAIPEGHYWALTEGDPLFITPTETMLVLASTARDADSIEVYSEHLVADFYDMNGRRLPLEERPDGWFEEQSETRNPGRNWATENAAHRLGDDYIVIGRGEWWVSARSTVDGEPAFEFVSPKEFLKRRSEARLQAERKFADSHPFVEGSKPWWATKFTVDTEFYDVENEQNDTDDALVIYEFETPAGRIYEGFHYHDGTLQTTQAGPSVYFEERECVVKDRPELARGVRELADVLERLAEEAVK